MVYSVNGPGLSYKLAWFAMLMAWIVVSVGMVYNVNGLDCGIGGHGLQC